MLLLLYPAFDIWSIFDILQNLFLGNCQTSGSDSITQYSTV